MAGRYTSRLAWSLWVLTLLLLPGVILEISLRWAGPGDLPFVVGLVAVQLGAATAGAIISSQLPGNAVGWIFLAIGLLLGLLFAAGAYADLAIHVEYGSLPGGWIAAWIGSWIFIPAAFGLPMFLLLLFPDGRFISKRWRLMGWGIGGLVVFATASKAFLPGRIPPGIENPPRSGGRGGGGIEGSRPRDRYPRLARFRAGRRRACRPAVEIPRRRTPATQVVHLFCGRRGRRPWHGREGVSP
jgi:hypothetical protein